MYVIILDSLNSSHRACQGGHAVAQYLLNKETDWCNGNMIYLKASKDELDKISRDPDAVCFEEEDFNNQLTAVAVVTNDRKRFAKLKLI